MALPAQTPEQQQESLRKARVARAERSKALAALRNGTVTFTEVLGDEESPLKRARVRQVLLALPGIGAVRADRIMADIGIDDKRRVAGLGTRQRAMLTAALS